MIRAVTTAALLCLPATAGAANEVVKWNEVATTASFSSGLEGNPLFDSRVLAMTHAAVHDALNSIDRRYQTYALHVNAAVAGASPEAAVATAAYRVLSTQFTMLVAFGFPSQQAQLTAAYTASLAAVPNGAAKDAGIKVGTWAADAILARRAADGWDQQVLADSSYREGTLPGEYRFTPPATFAFAPRWGYVEPFVLFRSDQFRPAPPYKVDSRRYTADFVEVKALGGNGTTTPSARTPDQTEIARFWYESSPAGWNRIARTLAAMQRLGLWDSARLFALLNLTLADGYIANFDTKYHYRYWRPITAIRLAATDGNPDTSADPNWTPLLETPPVPDYSSGHSVQGAAGATIFQLFFGTDRIPFTTCSNTMQAGFQCGQPNEVVRSFTTFSQAAEENALSRIYVGIHFRNAIEEGLKQGRRIAHQVFVHALRPVR